MNQPHHPSIEQAGNKPITIARRGYTILITECPGMEKPSHTVRLGKYLSITTDEKAINNTDSQVQNAFQRHFDETNSDPNCQIFASSIPYVVGVIASQAAECVRKGLQPDLSFLEEHFNLI